MIISVGGGGCVKDDDAEIFLRLKTRTCEPDGGWGGAKVTGKMAGTFDEDHLNTADCG